MDPYRPPASTVSDAHAAPGSAFKAVLLGFLVDIGGTTLGMLVLGFLYAALIASAGTPVEDIQAQFEASVRSGWGFAIATTIGGAFSVLGGYVCQRIARRRDLKLAWVLSALSVALSVLVAWNNYSLVEHLSLDALTVGCIVFGAKIAMRPAVHPAG
jgi:MFS family permease